MPDMQVKLMTPNALKGAFNFLKEKNTQDTNKSQEKNIKSIEEALEMLDGKPGISKEDYDIATDRLNRMIILREIKKDLNFDQNKRINNQILESYVKKELKGKTSSIEKHATLENVRSHEEAHTHLGLGNALLMSFLALGTIVTMKNSIGSILVCGAIFAFYKKTDNEIDATAAFVLKKDIDSLTKELDDTFADIPKLEQQLGKPKTLILGAQTY